ncbi:hypothetical protein TFLX_01026 [Thermoflexales bacterium]|nr:hypothetical protein TFLX_01026 [Thermoflexales bacterium]
MFPIIISITIGVIIALLAVFALPVRPWISRTAKRRSSVALLVAFIAFLTSFLVWTLLGASLRDVFTPSLGASNNWIGMLPEYQKNRPAVIKEVWIRQIVPPSLRQACYTDRIEICDLADCLESASQECPDVPWRDIEKEQANYLNMIGICGIAALTGSLVAWRFTRSIPARDTVI